MPDSQFRLGFMESYMRNFLPCHLRRRMMNHWVGTIRATGSGWVYRPCRARKVVTA